jgi:hypothetical protein
MNILKKFSIWWSWLLRKRVGIMVLIVLICISVAACGFMASIPIFFPSVSFFREDIQQFILNYKFIVLLLTPVCFYLSWAPFVFSINNYRIDIDSAMSFIATDPAINSIKIDELIYIAKKTKDSTKLNKWIANYKRLQEYREELVELQEQQANIPRLIEEMVQEIQALEIEL